MARKLTKKQTKFLEAYLKSRNAAEAYRIAYPPTGNGRSPGKDSVEGRRLLKNPLIAPLVSELTAVATERVQKRILVNLEQTLFEIARLGFSDVRKLFDEAGNLKNIQDLDDDIAAAVSGIEVTREKDSDGNYTGVETVKIKLWDKGNAQDRLMKHLGGYKADDDEKRPDWLRDLPREVAKAMLERLRAIATDRPPSLAGRATRVSDSTAG